MVDATEKWISDAPWAKHRSYVGRYVADRGSTMVFIANHPSKGFYVDWETPIAMGLTDVAAERGRGGFMRALSTEQAEEDWSVTVEAYRDRLANANDYFRRKAAEVFMDDTALSLLGELERSFTVNLADLNIHERGLALAKLTAAGFVEIGARVIYITEAGQRYVQSIEEAWNQLPK